MLAMFDRSGCLALLCRRLLARLELGASRVRRGVNSAVEFPRNHCFHHRPNDLRDPLPVADEQAGLALIDKDRPVAVFELTYDGAVLVKFGFSATASCSRSAWRNFSGGEIGVADVVTTSIGAKFLEQALKDLRHGSLLVPLARHCALGLTGFASSHRRWWVL
jgi:hypothetical protein